MPATTLVTARPAERPSVEAQAAIVPGHYLSSAVVEDPDAAGIQQLAATVEPDSLLGIRGLVVGGRVFGQEGDAPIEPMIGYRRTLDDGTIALGGVVYGTRAAASDNGASYQATRGGAELAADVRLQAPNPWLEVHLFGGLAATGLSVDGTYCTDANARFGADCASTPDPPSPTQHAHASGLYPAAHAGLGLELFRHHALWLQGGRLAILAAAGTMPRVEHGVQTAAAAYATIGVAVSLAFGADGH
jgi:hypothetical protein